jgi:DNA polymerase
MINIDFETFSAAGFRWLGGKWVKLEGASKSGLSAVGAEVYALHPSTRVICLAWDKNLWRPEDSDPVELLERIKRGETLSAWNSTFERWVWRCCLPQWPEIPLRQIVDSSPRARTWSIPGSLAGAAKVMRLGAQKDTRGNALIRKFSIPRNPTKGDPSLVTLATDDPAAAREFEEYCLQDVEVETALSRVLPELSPFELRVWFLDQEINDRGIPVDAKAVDNACEILRQAARVLNAELAKLTGGNVTAASQTAKLLAWVNDPALENMQADTITEYLKRDVLPAVRRALEIRQELGSTSTKKIWAFQNRTTAAGRLHGQLLYAGADRTARWAGRGTQPQNFPRGVSGWSTDKTEEFLQALECRDFMALQRRFGNVLKCLASSLRGLICASEGHDLIGSDYTAIEAVVLAVLAGEQWRIDVFNGHGKIYESSASKITGTSLDEYAAYALHNDAHHPDRGLGKLAELASGYGGGVGAWMKFGADTFFTPDRCEEYREQWEAYKHRDRHTLQEFAIQKQVWAWREASPAIVSFWKGLEYAAMQAVKRPGESHAYRSIRYQVERDVLYCTLPSGRRLAYHEPRIGPGKFGPVIFYRGGNKDKDKGPIGDWVQLNTYGGKLTENVVQAVARDILANALLNVEAAGYRPVMHVHDEIICEEKHGDGSVAELESIMGIMPDWATGWPVRAAGGWRGKRFRK